VARRLVEAGVDVFALAPVRASFEDVFLALTQEEPADV
jgi:hypothetical protein